MQADLAVAWITTDARDLRPHVGRFEIEIDLATLQGESDQRTVEGLADAPDLEQAVGGEATSAPSGNNPAAM